MCEKFTKKQSLLRKKSVVTHID